MTANQIIFLIFSITSLLSGFITIFILFYIGRTRIKDVDRIVYGFELPNDSIFALIIRVPSYAGAFIWEWSAKRSGLLEIRDKFDEQFKRPFKLSFYCAGLSLTTGIIAWLLMKYITVNH